MIETLTAAQEARFPEFVQKWRDIGLCTLPADRIRAEHGIRVMYEKCKKKPPRKIVWTTSPMAQGLTRAIVLSNGKAVENLSNGKAVENSVRQSVRDSMWDSVLDSMGDSMWDSVWQSMRQSVLDSVLDSMGDSMWDSVWQSMGDSVLDSMGLSVRQSVLDSVLDSMGDSMGLSVWQSVGDSGYGQHDANWLAKYDYFREVCDIRAQTEPLQGLWEVAKSAGWYLPHEHICWISERHHRLCLNTRGQLHSHDGMAVQYPDGWGVWAWNGVRVNEQIILHHDSLTPEQISHEKNAQVRQVMVERIGIERVCQMFKAQPLDAIGSYQLLILDLGDGLKRPYLKMLNPSVGVWHVEGVHPNCRTVQEALNWRNGLTTGQIDAVDGADWIQQGDVILKPSGATKFKPQPIQLT